MYICTYIYIYISIICRASATVSLGHVKSQRFLSLSSFVARTRNVPTTRLFTVYK